jgi:endonuclease/exonuclease/phosphatase family metal-dependent hydrolase
MNLYNGEEIKEEGKYLNYNQVEEGTSKIKPIKHYDRIHALQAEKIRGIINKSPYPVIVTGDFNSVPSSYVYHTIKGNLLDPFIKKGRGFSSSYKALSPTLRIDYILHDPSFKTIQFKTPKLYLSDHFPVVADLTWKDKR